MKLLSLGLARGVIAGLLGTGIGVAITMLVRQTVGLPAWNPGPVTTIGALVGVLCYLFGVGAFNYWLRWALGGQEANAEHGNHPNKSDGPQWTRYFSFDTNHKVIGIQYIVTSIVLGLVAGALAMALRVSLSEPGKNVLPPGTYNSFMSAHGIIMLLGVVIPGIAGIGNYLIPLMIGAKDMAFPRLNAFSYWLIPPAGLLMTFSLVAGGFDTGWVGYPPLSFRAPLGINLMYLGAYLGGLSSILGSINFITTILKMRAKGMDLFRMPIFAWAMLATAFLQLGFTQFIAMSFLMVLLERLLGMGFFRPEMGGNVILYQHLFWFYSHPAVYIFILPGLGIISEIVPVFSRKPLFGYKFVALSSAGIAIFGSLVWGHHMFTSGIEGVLRIPFAFSTLIVAVPTGVKIFSWLGTLWMGKIRLETPMLFVLTAIVVFLVGGITGVPQAIVPVDLALHDTYFIVAHFHYTLFGGFVFPIMAAAYYWYPKMTGRMYNETLGKVHWALMSIGYLVQTLPWFWLGLMGMPRRIATYDPSLGYTTMNRLATLGAFIVGLSVLIFVFNIGRNLWSGSKAPENPWDSRTLEWQTSSPPPEDNFEGEPEVFGPPYPYGVPGAAHARVNLPAVASVETPGAR